MRPTLVVVPLSDPEASSATRRVDPSANGSTARCDDAEPVGSLAALRSESDSQRSPPSLASARAGPFYCVDVLLDHLVQPELRHESIQPNVLVLKLLQFPDLV